MAYNNRNNNRNFGLLNTTGRLLCRSELAPGGPVGPGHHNITNDGMNNQGQNSYFPNLHYLQQSPRQQQLYQPQHSLQQQQRSPLQQFPPPQKYMPQSLLRQQLMLRQQPKQSLSQQRLQPTLQRQQLEQSESRQEFERTLLKQQPQQSLQSQRQQSPIPQQQQRSTSLLEQLEQTLSLQSQQQQPQQPSQVQQQQPSTLAQPTEQQNLLPPNSNAEMRSDVTEPANDSSENKPSWMRSKLVGVKKISNKERRRRQNENLRRLLAPKNALMVLNEMLPGERDVAQFKVEPALAPMDATAPTRAFCAELVVDGARYKGYGDNKIAARNDAAEQAIRDLIIKRMNKVNSAEVSQPMPPDGEEDSANPIEEEEAPLPMIQLASFALHKLFAEWECDGHKVPQLKPSGSHINDAASESSLGGSGPRARPPRALPASAADMHPCMLLTYMRPHLEYREMSVEGDRPQNMFFTMGIEVDGITYIGKAQNKREARKQAARAACAALYGVYEEPAALHMDSAEQ